MLPCDASISVERRNMAVTVQHTVPLLLNHSQPGSSLRQPACCHTPLSAQQQWHTAVSTDCETNTCVMHTARVCSSSGVVDRLHPCVGKPAGQQHHAFGGLLQMLRRAATTVSGALRPQVMNGECRTQIGKWTDIRFQLGSLLCTHTWKGLARLDQRNQQTFSNHYLHTQLHGLLATLHPVSSQTCSPRSQKVFMILIRASKSLRLKLELNHCQLPIFKMVTIHIMLLMGPCLQLALQLQGPGCNDQNLVERVYNVSTCIPFCAAGWKIIR